MSSIFSKKNKIHGEIVMVEVRHKSIKTDDLTCIAMIAQHYMVEVGVVEFAKVKKNDNNEVCSILCWTEGPVELVRIFLNKYFPLWRWDVS